MEEDTYPDPAGPSGWPDFAMPEGAEAGKGVYQVGTTMNSLNWLTFKLERVNKYLAEAESQAEECNRAPRSLEVQRRYVQLLFCAFKNTDNIVDKECKGGKICQAGQRIKQGFYSDEIIELACWEMFENAQTSQLGVQLVEKHHGLKLESHADFDSRWQSIVNTCAFSKAACKQALDPLYLHRLADAPATELKLKINNKRINAQRDLQNSVGRNILREHRARNEGNDSDPFKLEGGDLDDLQIADLAVDVHNALRQDNEDYDDFFTPQKRSSRKPTSKEHHGSSAKLVPKTPKNGCLTYTLPARDGPSMSTGKRKQGKAPLYAGADGDNEEDEDDDGDATYQEVETPVKKRAKGRATKGQHLNKPIAVGRTRASRKSSVAKNSPIPKTKSSPGADENETEYETEYKRRICDILGIDVDLGMNFTLHELRFYASAYDQSINGLWYYADSEGTMAFGKGFNVINPDGSETHLAMIFKKFLHIAYARGDLDENGNLKEGSTTHFGFDIGCNIASKKALGTVSNLFGIVNFGLPQDVPVPPFIADITQTTQTPTQTHNQRSLHSDYGGTMDNGISQFGRQTSARYSAASPSADFNNSFMGGVSTDACARSYTAGVSFGSEISGIRGDFVANNDSGSFSSNGTPENSAAADVSFAYGPGPAISIPLTSFSNADFSNSTPSLPADSLYSNGSSRINSAATNDSLNNFGHSMTTPRPGSFADGGSFMTAQRISPGDSLNTTGSDGTPQLPQDPYYTHGSSFDTQDLAGDFFNGHVPSMYNAPVAPMFNTTDDCHQGSFDSSNGSWDITVEGDINFEGSHDSRAFNFNSDANYSQMLHSSSVDDEDASAYPFPEI